MKKLGVFVLTGILISGGAQAAMRVNLLGGLNFQNDSITPATGNTTSAVGALSYGVTFEAALNPAMAFEVGVFSMGSKTKTTVPGAGDATIGLRSTVIPVMIRFTALPIIDFGVGGYYGILPKTFTVENSTIAGLPNGSQTATSAASSDYGIRAGIRANIPFAPMIHGLVDVSYDYGLKDTDTSSSTEKTRGYTLMAGVGIGF
jgi:hypothetical protein